MRSLDATLALVAAIRSRLDPATVPEVTHDPEAAQAALAAGKPAAIVLPPSADIDHPTVTYSHDVVLVSPVIDAIAAWPTLDDIATALWPLMPERIDLTRYQPHPQEPEIWPALQLTFTTTYTVWI